MQLSLSTWNSININDGSTFKAHIPVGQMANLSANPVTVNRALAFPFLSTTVLNPHVFVIQVTIVAGQNINTYRETLKKYFNVMDAQRHNLVALDLADSNKPYYLTGFPIRIAAEGDSPNSFFISLAVESPVWKLVTATTESNWLVTATGQTNAVTNAGNINVAPVITVTPTSAKTGGLVYRRWVGIYNNLDTSFNFPYDITTLSSTSGGLDTAALTTTKMQADGDDFLVMVDGVFVDRWLSAMDTTATQCWINLNLSPRREGATNTSIAGTGAVSTITFSKTKDNLDFLQAMARAVNKVVLIDSEAFTFTGANLVTCQLTGCTRAQKDSSMAAHTAPATVRWIEHDIWILYGDSTLTAPDVDNDKKPIFDLASYNSELFWTYPYQAGVNRPGAWRPGVAQTKSGLSYYFTATQNTFANSLGGYVATEMGAALVAPETEYNALIETGTVFWEFYHPSGIEDAQWGGKKYSTGSWPEVVGLQWLEGDQTWILAWDTEPRPSVLNTWESFGIYIVSSGAGFSDIYNTVRFVMDGSLSPVSNEKAMVQFDNADMVITTANLPTTVLGAETAIVWLDLTLTNNTSGEYIKVQTHCLEDTGSLTIDCESKKAYLQDGARVPVTLSTDREAWLDLRSGANTLQYDDTGTNASTVVVVHRDGNL